VRPQASQILFSSEVDNLANPTTMTPSTTAYVPIAAEKHNIYDDIAKKFKAATAQDEIQLNPFKADKDKFQEEIGSHQDKIDEALQKFRSRLFGMTPYCRKQ
jgi:hypothetical protein